MRWPVAATLQLDPGLFVDADERALADSLELRLHRQAQVTERLQGGDTPHASARRCRAEIPATRLR